MNNERGDDIRGDDIGGDDTGGEDTVDNTGDTLLAAF